MDSQEQNNVGDDIDFAWEFLNTVMNEKNEDMNIGSGSCDECKGCKSKNILDDYSHGYKVCGDCGEICDTIYDKSPEWSQYDDSKACGSARCGGPTNPFLPIASLGTTIMACGNSKIKKLHNWGQMPYNERALKDVLDLIDSECKKHHIVKAVSDCAQVLFSKIYKIKHTDGKNEGKKMIFRGKNRLSIIAACVYYGAIYQGQPRGSKEIASLFSLDVKQVSKGMRTLLELMRDDNIMKNLQTANPTSFIRNFCTRKLHKDYIPIAMQITDNVTKLDIASTHQPNSIAAACILLLVKHCNLNITKKDIICEFKISEPTLNKTLERLEKWKPIIMNNEISNMIYQQMNQDNSGKLTILNMNILEDDMEKLKIDTPKTPSEETKEEKPTKKYKKKEKIVI